MKVMRPAIEKLYTPGVVCLCSLSDVASDFYRHIFCFNAVLPLLAILQCLVDQSALVCTQIFLTK